MRAETYEVTAETYELIEFWVYSFLVFGIGIALGIAIGGYAI